MEGPALLEGERVHRILHPHPLARAADFAPGVLLLVVGAMLATGTLLGAWLGALRGELALPGIVVAWCVLVGLIVVPSALYGRGSWVLALGVLVAALGGVAAVVAPAPPLRAVGLVGLAGGLVALAAAEALRRAEGWWLTSFRVVHCAGPWKPREEAWMLHRLRGAQARHRGPRALRFGDVVLDLGEDQVVMRGLGRPEEVRDEVELLVHTQREAPYLGAQRQTADKVMGLLRREDPARR